MIFRKFLYISFFIIPFCIPNLLIGNDINDELLHSAIKEPEVTDPNTTNNPGIAEKPDPSKKSNLKKKPKKNPKTKNTSKVKKKRDVKEEPALDQKLDVREEPTLNQELDIKEQPALDQKLDVKEKSTLSQELDVREQPTLSQELDVKEQPALSQELDVREEPVLGQELNVEKEIALSQELDAQESNIVETKPLQTVTVESIVNDPVMIENNRPFCFQKRLIRHKPSTTLVEVKAGYFYPESSNYRHIYKNVWTYNGEVSCRLFRSIYAWGSAGYLRKSGHSNLGSPTTITCVPLGLGLKALYSIRCFDLYLGGGFLASRVHFHDISPFVIPRSTKWAFGGVFKTGALISISKRFFIDLFVDYTLLGVHFHDTDHGKVERIRSNLSGVTAGIGIGYRFGK